MKYFFENIKNNIDFFLRNKLVFSRKNYNGTLNEKEYLYFTNAFNKYLSKISKEKISVLDIGSKNWSYVKSEHDFFNSVSECELNGIELDAYRVCTNFYSRYEIAKYYTKDLKNTNYIVGDFMNHNLKHDYIIWILPFITEYPHIMWGLPKKYFKPLEMLEHAYNLLNEEGELLIINQGENEYEIQKEMNEKLNLNTEYFGEIEDIQNTFKNKRYCCKIKKG